MKFYGEKLFCLGIIFIIIALIASFVFFMSYLFVSRKLKKQLEDEYGSQNK